MKRPLFSLFMRHSKVFHFRLLQEHYFESKNAATYSLAYLADCHQKVNMNPRKCLLFISLAFSLCFGTQQVALFEKLYISYTQESLSNMKAWVGLDRYLSYSSFFFNLSFQGFQEVYCLDESFSKF